MTNKRNKTSRICKVLLCATVVSTCCAALLLRETTFISARADASIEEEVSSGTAAIDVVTTYYTVKMGDEVFVVAGGVRLAVPQEPTKEPTTEYVYLFDGWYEGDRKWDFEKDRVTHDVTLTPKFIEAKRKYTVSFVVTGNDNVTFEPVQVEYGSVYDLSTLLEGMDVSKYNYVIGVDGKATSSVTVLSDVTVVITFKEKVYYTVTINGVDVQMEIGSKLDKPADPTKESTEEYDYVFDGWYNGDEEWNFEEDTVDGALNLIAKYKEVKRKYTISFNIGGNSDISIGEVEMEYGDIFDVSKFIEGLNIVGYTYSVSLGDAGAMKFKVVEDVKIDISFTKKIANEVKENKDEIIEIYNKIKGCFSGIDGSTAGMLLGASALALAFKKRKKD